MNDDQKETMASNPVPLPAPGEKGQDAVPTVHGDTMHAPTTAPIELEDPFVGTMLGNYRLVSLLGKGGFGKVYKGVDTILERPAAIKFLLNPLNEVGRTLFEREARAIAALSKHPHIVSIYEWGQHENQFYFVLEFVEGGAPQLLEMHPDGLPLRMALRLTAECAEALHTAHEQGILHRDIKPANILIEAKSGIAKLTDFGLAHIRDSNEFTLAGSISGSPPYMSPEQAAAGELDQRSDVFSLGVTLYELLSGQRPFEGETTAEVLGRIRNNERVPFSARRPDLGQAVVDLVEKATAHRPGDRFASAAEFARKLRVLIDRIDRSGELTPQVSPAPQQAWDKRLLGAGIGIAAVALIGGAAFFLTRAGADAPPPAPPVGAVAEMTGAGALMARGDYAAAEQSYLELIANRPQHAASVLDALFLTRYFQGKFEEAGAALEEIDDPTLKAEAAALLANGPAATSPTSPLLLVPHARALLATGDAEGVVALLAGLDPRALPYPWLFQEAQNLLGQAHYRLGNFEAAQAALGNAGADHPLAAAYRRVLDEQLQEDQRTQIREAAQRIRAMLDSGEAATRTRSDDLWTSRPLTFFTLPPNGAATAFAREPGLPPLAGELLSADLEESGLMRPVDRANIAAILGEQDLAARLSVNTPSGQLALGQLLGGRLILQCGFGSLGGRDFVTVTATDVESGRKHTMRVELPEEYPGPVEVITLAADATLSRLSAQYPLQGRIYREGDTVLLNIGAQLGVNAGMAFAVFDDPLAPPIPGARVTIAPEGIGASQARVTLAGIDPATLPEDPKEGLPVRVLVPSETPQGEAGA